MSAFLYMLSMRYFNSIKRMFLKPLLALFTCICIVGAILTLIMSFLYPMPGLGVNLHTTSALIPLSIGILFGGITFAQQFGVFTLADANLIFCSPVSPRQVILFSIIETLSQSFFIAIFATFYLPYLTGGQINFGQYLLVLLLITLVLCFVLMFYYYLYMLDCSPYRQEVKFNLRKKASLILLGIMGLFIACFVYVLFRYDFNPLATSQAFFSNRLYNVLPLFGWAKMGIMGVLEGQYLTAFIPSLILLTTINIITSILIMRSKVDFYEKALSDSYAVKDLLDKVKNKEFETSDLIKTKTKIIEHVEFRSGAAAIFSRHILEIKKTAGVLSKRHLLNSFMYLVFFSLISPHDFTTVSLSLIFILSIEALGKAWKNDFKKPYLFLIPEISFKKVIYSALPSLFRTSLSGAIVLTAAGIFYSANILDIVSYILLLPIITAVCIFSEILVYRITCGTPSVISLMFLKTFFVCLALIPTGVVLLIMLLVMESLTLILAIPFIIIVNIGVCVLLAYFSRNLFEKSEIMDQ